MPDTMLVLHTIANGENWQKPACEIWTAPEHVAKNVLDREYLRGIMTYTWKFDVALTEEILGKPGAITSRVNPRKEWF